MTGSERMQLVAGMLVEAAQLAKATILDTAVDETINETSLAYFAGHVGSILVIAKRLEDGVRRIDGWHNQIVTQTPVNVEAH